MWSPDGRQIAFTSNRDQRRRFRHSLYVAPSNGTGDAQLLDETANVSSPDWSPDGRHIIYNRETETTADVWTIDLAGDRTPRPFLNTRFQNSKRCSHRMANGSPTYRRSPAVGKSI